MPLYEYRCAQGCDPQLFEKFVPIKNRDKPQKCPECGSLCDRKRLYSTPFIMPGFSGTRARPEVDWNPS